VLARSDLMRRTANTCSEFNDASLISNGGCL
jgi:hypothetical protein